MSFDFRSVGGVPVTQGDGSTAWMLGWVNRPDDVEAIKSRLQFPTADKTPVGSISTGDLPKSVHLWKLYEQLHPGKKCPGRNQLQVGSCVSFGTAKAIEHTMCSEIVMGDPEEFRDLAQEVIYGGSRVEIGGGQINGDGSVGAWAAEFVKKYGVVARGKYGNVNLEAYSESTCRKFGSSGVPAELEVEARLHPVSDTTQVNDWENGRKMIAAGHGIAICSNRGFVMQRDSQGRCRPSGTWYHCMAFDGYEGDDEGHITNSWGLDAHTGPVGAGDPNTDGFWTDADTIDKMLRQKDSWAFAGVKGWRSAPLPLWLI